MRRLSAFIVAIVIILSVTDTGGGVEAQDGAEATIEAQATEITELRATSQARGARINAQRTQIAELEALLPVVNDDPAIGDVFAVRDFELTLQGTELAEVVGNSFLTEEANGIYLLINVDVANVSDSPEEFPYDDFQVEDGRGRSYSYDFQAVNVYVATETQASLFEPLQPGVIYSTVIIFDVPEDATGFTLTTTRNDFEAPLDRERT